jgi:hypothetical protein
MAHTPPEAAYSTSMSGLQKSQNCARIDDQLSAPTALLYRSTIFSKSAVQCSHGFLVRIKLAWLEIAGVSGTVLTTVGVTRKIQSVSTKALDGP